MRSADYSGFTLSEVMISIAIVGIISVAAFYSLRQGRMNDELNTAVRVVASDLRNVQSRALTAQNVKFCEDTSTPTAKNIVCENSTALCQTPVVCTAVPPAGVGVHLTKAGSGYDFYAKYDPGTTDWREVDPGEVFFTRSLATAGASNVKISKLGTADMSALDVAFQRQNGNMLIDACPAGCTNLTTITITLQHKVSLKTASVSLNTITGRISID